MKDIFSRTNNLIYKYRQIIQDELHVPEFNEFSLEHFDICLSLLVKIEDDKTELMSTFLERYKLLINKKFDEIFSMRENTAEIDFNTYSKIYYNYEFSINENEFLFYESQIDQLQVGHNNDKSLHLSHLTSKYFKKGTFIWICKKIQETILGYFIPVAFKYFTGLFDKAYISRLNELYNYIIDIFNNKVKDLIKKEVALDPIFFKEGLISFYYPFADNLQKITTVNSEELIQKILSNNKQITKDYINLFKINFAEKIANIVKSYFPDRKEIYETHTFTRESNLANINSLQTQLVQFMSDNLSFLKKLDFIELYNTSAEEATKLHFEYMHTFINLFYFVIKSANFTKFSNIDLIEKELSEDQLDKLRLKIQEIFGNAMKERIYIKILLCKSISGNIKFVVDKYVKEFPMIKNNKNFYNDLRSYFDKENTETNNLLYDAIIQYTDITLFPLVKKLFFDVDWLKWENAITYRLDLRDICYDLYHLKCELFDVLSEERKTYEDTYSTSFNEGFLKKKQQKQTRFQKEMLCFNIRRMSIYETNTESPQLMMMTIAKIFFKVSHILLKEIFLKKIEHKRICKNEEVLKCGVSTDPN